MHHLRPVGRDREGDAVLDEGTKGVADGVLVREGLGEQVRGGTDLEHGARIPQLAHELGVARRKDAVPDPLRPQVLDHLAQLLRAGLALLTDVDRDAEAGLTRRRHHGLDLRVVVPAAARAGPGDVDPDHAARGPADRLLDDDLVLPRREGAVHHQDQPAPHLRVLEPGDVEASDGREDDVVEIPLAAAVALHRVEAELERRDPLRAVGAADRGVHRALDRERGGLDQLRPVVDPVERIEVGDAARVGDRDERVELPVVLHRQRDALLVRERPEDLGRDGAAEVGVELSEALVEHPPECIHRTNRRVGATLGASAGERASAEGVQIVVRRLVGVLAVVAVACASGAAQRPLVATDRAPFSSTVRRRSRSCLRRDRSRGRRHLSGRDALAEVASAGADVPQDRPGDRRLDRRGHRGRKAAEPSRSREPPPHLGQPEHGRRTGLSARRASRASRHHARERRRRRGDRDVERSRRALLERHRSERAPVRLLPCHRPRRGELVRRQAGSRRRSRLGDDSGATWYRCAACPVHPRDGHPRRRHLPGDARRLGTEPPRRRHLDEHDRVGHAEPCGVDDAAGLCEREL